MRVARMRARARTVPIKRSTSSLLSTKESSLSKTSYFRFRHDHNLKSKYNSRLYKEMELGNMEFERVCVTLPFCDSPSRVEYPADNQCIDDAYLLEQLRWMYPGHDFKATSIKTS